MENSIDEAVTYEIMTVNMFDKNNGLVIAEKSELEKIIEKIKGMQLITWLDSADGKTPIRPSTLPLLRQLKKFGYAMKEISFDTLKCYIAAYDFLNFFKEPKKNSPGSKCMYLGVSTTESDSYLLQIMPPFSISSWHYHEKTTETYYNLHGRCIINIDDKDIILPRKGFIVEPYQKHFVVTENRPSLTLLHLTNPYGLSMEDHKYIDMNNKEFENPFYFWKEKFSKLRTKNSKI